MNSTTVIICLTVLGIAGIGAVIWIMKNDKDDNEDSSLTTKLDTLNLDEPQQQPISTTKTSEIKSTKSLLSKLASVGNKLPKRKQKDPSSPKSASLLVGVLGKFKLDKKKSNPDDRPETVPLPNLKEYFGDTPSEENTSPPKPYTEPEVGTSSIKTTSAEHTQAQSMLSKSEEENIEKEINLTTELDELKEKHNKLEALYNEKSTEYNQAKESVKNELDNRKEFNKVKDLLEKELKESKDKTRNVEVQLNNTLTENESQKKRTQQLEEKTTRLEKELLEKEDEVNELVKRMQTFASPTTAATPPQPEETPKIEKKEEDTSKPHLEEAPLPKNEPSDNQPKTNDKSPADADTQSAPSDSSESFIVETIPTEVPSSAADIHTPDLVSRPTAATPEITEKPKQSDTPPSNESEEEIKLTLTKDADTTEESTDESKDEPFLKLQPDTLASSEPQKNDTQTVPESEQSDPPVEDSKIEGKLSQYLDKKKASENPESSQNNTDNSNGKEEK